MFSWFDTWHARVMYGGIDAADRLARELHRAARARERGRAAVERAQWAQQCSREVVQLHRDLCASSRRPAVNPADHRYVADDADRPGRPETVIRGLSMFARAGRATAVHRF